MSVRLSDHEPIGTCREFTRGRGHARTVEGHKLVVFRLGEEFHVLEDVCPHAQAPLSDGDVARAVVTCPYHGWAFDVRTGESTNVAGARVKRFSAVVHAERLWVKLA